MLPSARLLLAPVLALCISLPAAAGAQRADRLVTRPAVSAHATVLDSSSPFGGVKEHALATGGRKVETSRSERRRRWWLLPAIGAAAGAVGLTVNYLSYCRHSDDGCMSLAAVPAFGAAAGAVLGGVAELAVRGVEAVLDERRKD
jgi:hypothetical protein